MGFKTRTAVLNMLDLGKDYWTNLAGLGKRVYTYVLVLMKLKFCIAKVLHNIPISLTPYSVHLTYARVNRYLHSLIPFTGRLWKSLPVSVFPPTYDLNP